MYVKQKYPKLGKETQLIYSDLLQHVLGKNIVMLNTLRNDLQRFRVCDWSGVEFTVLWSLLIGSIIENQF